METTQGKRFVLLYQIFLANVLREDFDQHEERWKWTRVHQGCYRDAEMICHGADLCHAVVEIKHWDHAGDALSAGYDKWEDGPGDLWLSSKYARGAA